MHHSDAEAGGNPSFLKKSFCHPHIGNKSLTSQSRIVHSNSAVAIAGEGGGDSTGSTMDMHHNVLDGNGQLAAYRME